MLRLQAGASARTPGVRIVVASNSSMANCPAASFHDQNTAFTSLSRIQGAGTSQSQASRHAFRYQRCKRAQHVRRHPQEVAAKRKQENGHDSLRCARCYCCTGRPGVCLVARTVFDGAAAELRTGRHGPLRVVPRAWRVRAPAGIVAPGVLHACRARLARGHWRLSRVAPPARAAPARAAAQGESAGRSGGTAGAEKKLAKALLEGADK